MKQLKILSLIALPTATLIAFGLDKCLANLLLVADRAFSYRMAALLLPIINLLYAILVMGLFWIMSRVKDWRIGMLYLCTGLFLILLVLFRLIGVKFALSLPLDPVMTYPQRGFWIWGALLAATGLWGILGSVNPGLWVERGKSD
jgi:heme/copper-type cytochrome/quinol oxidase subunit 4